MKLLLYVLPEKILSEHLPIYYVEALYIRTVMVSHLQCCQIYRNLNIAQCMNLRIFLSLRFYVKSTLEV